MAMKYPALPVTEGDLNWQKVVIALRMGPDDIEAGAWTFISACLILTGLVVAFVEWQARLHHRNVCRDIEVRVKAVEEQS